MKTKIFFLALIFSSISLFSQNEIQNTSELEIQFNPQWNENGNDFRHSWEGYVSIDQAHWILQSNMQSQIAMAHKELNAKNVRTVCILDDIMRVYAFDPKTWRDKDRKPRYNFRMIDEMFQSLLDMGVNPVVSTNFMPKLMASTDADVFKTGSSAPPRDYKEWENLISLLSKHLVNHFGAEVVKKWEFEVWNEPNLDYFWKDANKEEFFKLWAITYRTIKSVIPEAKIGGPTTARAEWIPEFIEYGRKNNCEPDYIIVHIYNNDSEFSALSPFDGPQTDKINRSPNYLAAVVKGARKHLNELGYKGELHFNEWGRSWFPTDEIRDTPSEAAFIVMSMINCSQYADRLTYWCLSDIFDQAGYASEAFYGGFGMLSMDGLKKPSYKAFQLLGKLGDKQLSMNTKNTSDLKNGIATKNKNGYQFLFYDYEKDYIPTVTIPKKQHVSLVLPAGTKRKQINIFRVNSTENNILFEWAKMQKPEYLNKEQLEQLKTHNILEKYNDAFSIEKTDNGDVLKFSTESSSIAFVEILK